MNEHNSNIAKMSVMILLMLGFWISYTYVHELTHQEIAKHHGCIESKITILPKSEFNCLQYSEIHKDKDMVRQEKLLHSINEIFGYALQVVVEMLIMMSFILKSK